MAAELGTIAVGKKADLVLYDLTDLSLLPRTDPIGLLVLGRPANVVHSVWINGKLIVTEGNVTTTNVAELQQELFDRSQWHPNRRSPGMQQVEARYRAVMSLTD
jgi:cytosine/adenosine deaminase-related metal-dependent hydrolase